MNAQLLEAVAARHRDRQIAAVALMVWSEALRDPALHRRLRATLAAMTQEVAGLVAGRQRDGTWAGVPEESIAHAIVSILPGFLLDLALRGPDAVAAVPDAVPVLFADRDGGRRGRISR